MLRSEDDALYFYGKLMDLDPGFQSFDYSRGEVPALSEVPAMKWFCDRFRDTLHQPILPRKRIRGA